MNRPLRSVALAAALCVVVTTSGQAEAGADTEQARRGPALSVPLAELRASLKCTANVAGADRPPVLFVPGTTFTPEEQYGWNYVRAFRELRWPMCTVTTPDQATGDMQVAAEYVVHALRAMHRDSRRKVSILGGSQGGTLPRWALRFWPDTRDMVDDLVALGPPNHGSEALESYCVPNCVPALWQLLPEAAFVQAMNSGQETFRGISYTVIYSETDTVVTPPAQASSLRSGDGAIANIALQQVCPGHAADHVKTLSYDPVGYALAVDALTNPGPAEPDRIAPSVCADALPPGVDPATFPTTYASVNVRIVRELMLAERADQEPPLRCYATSACR